MYLKKEIKFGNQTLSIETGKLAKQAAGSVIMQAGETVLLVTVTKGTTPKLGDFSPLTVDVISKMYAAGKIPGGYFKRETKPPESDILISRLTDRPIRPLFPDGYCYETNIVVTVLSVGEENIYESLSMTGASVALMFSPIPFLGPIAGAKIGRVNGQYILNPTLEELKVSDIDISVAASLTAIVMVEGECKEVSEDVIVEALKFAHDALKPICQLQIDMAKELDIKKIEDFEKLVYDEEIIKEIRAKMIEPLIKATLIKIKQDRYETYDKIDKETKQYFAEKYPDKDISNELTKVSEDIKRELIRGRIAKESLRIDGRNLTTIRKITCETGILPRVHGTGVFTRGETQALVTVTLGSGKDAQFIDSIDGDLTSTFMLHYNFPPFSVGEARPLKSPGRREIGHGNLAMRGIKHVLPTFEEFPYTIRIVSEILESNGSSSMATVCGSTLALLDAGVPIKKPVAGIAMGLIEQGTDFYVLSDILGDEDHLGDMDFKVVGTKDGITSLQMDIKVNGLPEGVLSKALQQAKEGRIFIIDKINETISKPNEEMSKYAPRILTIKINPEKIGALIGQGGKNIKKIAEITKSEIEITDDGTVKIFSPNAIVCETTKKVIMDSIAEAEWGKTYEGTVIDIKEFGAIVQILPNIAGLVHISEIAHERVNKVEDYLKVGDVIKVKVISLRDGKTSLSLKALIEPPKREESDKEENSEEPKKYDKPYEKKEYNKPYKKY